MTSPCSGYLLHYANESCISAVVSSTLSVSIFLYCFGNGASIVFERKAYSYKIPDQFRSECFLVKDAAEPELTAKEQKNSKQASPKDAR